jgi:heparin binding hemagglutinin HbhA
MAPTGNKTRKTTITANDPTPLYALVGAGDFAVATLRTAGAGIGAGAAKLSPKALLDQAQSSVGSAPGQIQALPGKAQAVLTDTVTTAMSTYGELAGRGKTLVTRVRRQSATADLQDQTQATVSKVKAAATTTKKSATATATAAKSASTTTRKSAARTQTAAKSAATSARKTASAAKKAAEATADKVGN